MSGRMSLVLALIVILLGTGYTQQSGFPQPVLPTGPATYKPPSTAPQAPKEKSLDQMFDELEALRAKKAEIDKSEQELIKAIQQKAVKQAERMKQLGIETLGAKRVGRIIIQGNTITDDDVFLKMLDLYPGQVLDSNRLEEANARLKKAEKKRIFQSATVEVLPNEFDSIYKDILVKVKEKE